MQTLVPGIWVMEFNSYACQHNFAGNNMYNDHVSCSQFHKHDSQAPTPALPQTKDLTMYGLKNNSKDLFTIQILQIYIV